MADNPLTKKQSQQTIDTTTPTSTVSALRADSMFTGQLKPLLENQYGIFLWNTITNSADPNSLNLNPANADSPPEYFFSVAPKVLEMGDPFATQVTATQAGGKFVESHGSIIKPIRISGTTGARPHRRNRDVANIPLIGDALNQLGDKFDVRDKNGAIPPSEATGYDDIIFLRNIFRKYSDYRENNQFSNHIIMVWYNAKDGDSWIVEPQEFRMNRNASSPLTYEYNITFQTLAKFTGSNPQDNEDPLAKVLMARKIFSRIQEYQTDLKNTFLIVSTQIRRLEGLGVFAETQLLSPIINVTRGLGVIRATASLFGARLRVNAIKLKEELDNAIDLLTGTPGVEAQDALVRSLRRTLITTARILAEPGVQESVGADSSNRQNRYTGSYATGGTSTTRARTTPDLGGSSTFIGNNSISGNVGQDFVNGGEDIRAIAGRLLGDKAAWQSLVVLNQLQAPYISSDGRTGTLTAGDPILYHTLNTGVDASTISPANSNERETDGKDKNTLGPAQQAYGRDIRLASIPLSNVGVAVTDLKINQSGDYSTIVGIPNVEQAIIIKFSTEQGELPVHRSFGASFPIGSKATPSSLNEFRVKTIATINSDSRVKNIKDISFVTVADVLAVNATLLLINATDSLNTSVSLRSV